MHEDAQLVHTIHHSSLNIGVNSVKHVTAVQHFVTLVQHSVTSVPLWNIVTSVQHPVIAILQFKYVLESHVVKSSMKNFMHTDSELIYLHLFTELFYYAFSLVIRRKTDDFTAHSCHHCIIYFHTCGIFCYTDEIFYHNCATIWRNCATCCHICATFCHNCETFCNISFCLTFCPTVHHSVTSVQQSQL